MSATFHVVISGECFGCKAEMNRMHAGVLIRRPTTRSDGGAAALCSVCLDRAAGMILAHFARLSSAGSSPFILSDDTKPAGGSSEPGGDR